LFAIAPLGFTVVMRIFTLDFIAMNQANCLDSFSAIGIDPYSRDWDNMLRKMRKMSRFGFDGDHKTFDGKLQPECMYEAMEIISDWYDLYLNNIQITIGEENHNFSAEQCRLMRRVLVDELIHTLHMGLDLCYYTHQGNPSGNPLTAVINTIVNAIYLRVAYYKCIGGTVVGSFSKNVREFIYGDDLVVAVHDDVRAIYNYNTVSHILASYGLVLTPAHKLDEDPPDYMLLENLKFLKCTSRYNTQVQAYVPLIDKTTIQELTNWVRASNEQEGIAQLYVNIENGERLAFHYGKNYYDEYNGKVNRALQKAGLQVVANRFELLQLEFISKMDG